MRLETINWPVYVLKDDKPPVTVDKVSAYIANSVSIDTGELNHNILVIDDKNIAGKNLGERRLRLRANGNVNLYPLRRAIYMLGDLIRLTVGKKSWAIDSNGVIFNYLKTTRASMTCHKILKVLRVSTGGYSLEVEGISERFKILNEIRDCKYAGIISYNRRNILYGLYEYQFKKTSRSV